MFKLVIQDDEGKTTVVPLIRDEITIGRKEGNTIRLTERNVSRRHARILRNNGEVQIEDLGSYNGIRVNNARIAERVSLRVSDQVQIGDYKLYLKAEGIEQVDEARTMPIERLAEGSPGADVLAAGSPGAAPTQPMGIPATPTPARLVGDPNRTLVSVADTDPQGRPVASAATVAALSAPVGYGKLVVLSSNFWGKEFELSRPQMIIGRTDENDIVVNHRSISRNHAKLVREPETARYTISDLQSSNGVRVNGQDYGKVELRRGDVVDLGHVRLRFVEPGEDFVFARDAVITDVPDAGGKRGLMVGVIAAVVLVAVIVAFLVMKSMNGNNNTVQGSQDGSDAAQIAIGEDAAPQVAPPPEVDAPAAVKSVGSNGSGDDAANIAKIKENCLRAQTDEKWDDLIDCGTQLKKYDAKAAGEFTSAGNREVGLGPTRTAFEEALSKSVNNIKKAKQMLETLQQGGSVYYDRYKAKYDLAAAASVDDLAQRLKRVSSRDCKDYYQLLKNEGEGRGKSIADQARARVPCTPVKAVDRCKEDPKLPGCPEAVATPPPCDPQVAADQKAKGIDLYASGAFSAALGQFELSLKCKSDADTGLKAFMASCAMKNTAKARVYWKRFPSSARPALSICVRNQIQESDLDAP